ncbi:YlbD family protein [Bacillaceae bacterium S4-13-56]
MAKSLDPSVQEFKEFVQKHPDLIRQVRKKGESWQTYYEKWVLLGEEDPFWEQFKDETNTKGKKSNSKEKSTEFLNQMMGMLEQFDLNKVQGHLHNLDGALGNIQTLVKQFQEMKGNQGNQGNQGNSSPKSPFHFHQD